MTHLSVVCIPEGAVAEHTTTYTNVTLLPDLGCDQALLYCFRADKMIQTTDRHFDAWWPLWLRPSDADTAPEQGYDDSQHRHYCHHLLQLRKYYLHFNWYGASRLQAAYYGIKCNARAAGCQAT